MDYKNCKLYGVSNKKYLSELLRIDLKLLKDVENYFSTDFHIQRKGKKERYIYAPNTNYKRILKRLNWYISKVQVPDFAIGGMKNKSYITNGSKHINNKYFLQLDIKDFYPSTTDYYIYGFFKNNLKMSTDIAKICTLLVTEPHPYKNDYRHLPQGYPTSSLLSFLAYSDMYLSINKYAASQDIIFTCFVDDMTFSSQKFISKSFKRNVINIVRKYGLQLNGKKTNQRRINNGIKITGTFIKENKLFAPNKLQKDMINTYSELCATYENNPDDLFQLRQLCNQLQGYYINLKLIEKDRSLNYIEDLITEVRKYIRKNA